MTQHLVLVPGLNNTRAVFDGVLAALPPTVRAHALDNPALPSTEAIAQALLPHLPERFWLAGFSFGGYVALAMLEAAPERVQGIALVCTSPFGDAPQQAQKRLDAIAAAREGRYFSQIEAQAANAFHPDALANAALMQARSRMLRDYGAERYIAHVQATMARPDRTHLLDASRPTLVVAASHDKVFEPSVLRAYAETIAGAQWRQIDGSGHLLPMEKPAALAQVLAAWMRDDSSMLNS